MKTTRLFTGIVAGAVLAALGGCSSISVKSSPEGARILWSHDGLNYKAWPTDSFEIGDSRDADETPFHTYGMFGDTLFVTVEKEGYIRPRPQVVELYPLRREKLEFTLQEEPDVLARRMRAEGYLLYQGEWVRPEEAGVAEYKGRVMKKEDAFRLQQLDKGLVEYNGEWVTVEAAKEAEAAEKLAAGFVQYKDRWMKPGEKEEMEKVDALVADISRDKAGAPDLDPPKFIARTSFDRAQVQIYNSSPQQVRFLFSGPDSRSFTLDPYKSYGVRGTERVLLPAGRYEVAVIPLGIDASGRPVSEYLASSDGESSPVSSEPLWASWPLSSGTLVSFNFSGGANLDESLGDFELPDTQLNIDAPEIEIPEVNLPDKTMPRERPGSGRRR